MKKEKVLLLVLAVIIVIIGGFCYLKWNVKDNSSCSDNYCTYKYDGKEYKVLNNGYNKEHDIEYFNVMNEEVENIPEFSNLNYEEYSNFCLKYGINKKYNDDDRNYIVYFYTAKVANSINAKLGDVKYEGNKVTLYIWSKVNYDGGMIIDDGAREAYVIIIPTDMRFVKYKIEPLIHRIEYNKIAKLNPLSGYSYTVLGNRDLALKAHINSNNTKLNEIINKSIDAIAKEHTIKIVTNLNNADIQLISYFDLVNSVFEFKPGLSALHYFGYADDMRVGYFSYSKGEYSYTHEYTGRERMFFDVYYYFGGVYFLDIDSYGVSIQEDKYDYVITFGSYSKATYYINKKTYLIDRVEEDDRTSDFSYVNKKVVLPNELVNSDIPVTVKN